MLYSTREVAEIYGINESTLRYWEKHFPQIAPKTTSKGVRQYSQADIDKIAVLHNLVKVRGFRLDSARKMLARNKGGIDRSAEILSRLIDARDELTEIRQMLNLI